MSKVKDKLSANIRAVKTGERVRSIPSCRSPR